jgi:hypothetical protein
VRYLDRTEGVALLPKFTSASERADELEGEIARGGSCGRGGGLEQAPGGRHLGEDGHGRGGAESSRGRAVTRGDE